MKLLISFIVLYFGTIFFCDAQVGIGTENPQRTLHVEGGVKIKGLIDQSTNVSHDKILVVNDEGDVNYVRFYDVQNNLTTDESDKNVFNSIYSNTVEKAKDISVTCGKFVFKFIDRGSNNLIDIRFKLIPEILESQDIYLMVEQNWTQNNNNGYQFQSPTTSKRLTAGPNSPFVDMPYNNTAELLNGELNIINFIDPVLKDLYKITIHRVNQSRNQFDFVITCEKF